MVLQIDLSIQGPIVTFCLYPQTKKHIKFPKDRIVAESLTLEFEDPIDFVEIYKKSPLKLLLPLGLTELSYADIKEQGFTEILFFDTMNSKELLRRELT
jgi:hypothetical protein